MVDTRGRRSFLLNRLIGVMHPVSRLRQRFEEKRRYEQHNNGEGAKSRTRRIVVCSDQRIVVHMRLIARSWLYLWRKSFRQASCMNRDFEKDSVLRTKRARRCRSVLFQRSTWAVSPVSFPTALCCSSGITIC